MKQQINLYQGRLRRERPAFSALTMGAALAVCVVGLTVTWLAADRNARSLQADLEGVRGQEAAATARLESLTRTLAERSGNDGATQTLRDALSALAARERMLQLIDGSQFGNSDGFSAPIRELAEYSVPGLWLTRVQVWAPDMRTTLEGRARSPSLVPEYLLGLSAEGALGGQRFDQFEIEQAEEDDDPTVHFSMTSEVAQQFALQDSLQ